MKYNIRQLNISKLRFFLSGFVFLVTALGYYSFFYLFREAIRFESITEEHDILILSDLEVYFYNVFYAAIAILLAISSSIQFLIEKPIALPRGKTIRSSILNDMRMLNFSFLAWASKLAFAIGLFFTSFQFYYDYSFISDFAYLLALIVIVLYLQTWTNIIRYIKINRAKSFLFTSMFLIASSLVLGTINFIDYKKINSNVLSKNIYFTYELHTPKSPYWRRVMNSWRLKKVFVVHDKNNPSEEPIYLINDMKMANIEALDSTIKKWKKQFPRHSPGHQIQLNVNGKTPMKFVNQIKHNLAQSDIYKIGYGVVPQEAKDSSIHYKNYWIPARLFNYDKLPTQLPNLNLDTLEIIIEERFVKIQGKNIEKSKVDIQLKKWIIDHPKTHFILSYRPDTPFRDFVQVYASILQSISATRNELAIEKYSKEYASLSRSEKSKLISSNPIIFSDFTYMDMFDIPEK